MRESAEQLNKQTQTQLQILRARREELASRAAAGPRLGLVYGLQLPGVSITLAWALIGVHPDEQDTFLAVPADDNPLAGGDDVVVAESSGTGPLTMRCGYCTWIGARDLEPDKLEGWIDELQLQQAREAVRAVALGELRGGEQAYMVDATAEYGDWIGLIAHAQQSLRAFSEHREMSPAAPTTEAIYEDSLAGIPPVTTSA